MQIIEALLKAKDELQTDINHVDADVGTALQVASLRDLIIAPS